MGEAIGNSGNQGAELGRTSEQSARSFQKSGFRHRSFHQTAVPVRRGHVQRLLRPGRRRLRPQTGVSRAAGRALTAARARPPRGAAFSRTRRAGLWGLPLRTPRRELKSQNTNDCFVVCKRNVFKKQNPAL